MNQYQRGYRDGYADMSRGLPARPDGAPGSRYSQGYRQGKRDAAADVRDMDAQTARAALQPA